MKRKYQYPVGGLPEVSKPVWDKRYCFFPRTSCPFCGRSDIVYGAFVEKIRGQEEERVRVRYLCASCGHSDDVRRVEFIPKEADAAAKEERMRRMKFFEGDGTWDDVIKDAMARETFNRG